MDNKTHQDGSKPQNHEVFVFGSNLAGRHGKGAALLAVQEFGAQYGLGVGYMQDKANPNKHCYAIPTKDGNLKSLPLEVIAGHIEAFLNFAHEHQDLNFFVTRVGCVLAKHSNQDVAPLFKGAPSNVSLPEVWIEHMKPKANKKVF